MPDSCAAVVHRLRWYVCCAMTAAAFCQLADASWAAEPGTPQVTGDVTDVVVVRSLERHPGSARLWEPYIAQWADRRLVVAFRAGIPEKTDMGDILCCVSPDDGKSWGEAIPIFDHRRENAAFAYANPVLYHPPAQDVLWCFAMRCPMARPHSEDSQLAAAYSGDGGRSWISVELVVHYSGPVIIVGGIQHLDGPAGRRYLLPVHRNSLRNDPRGSRDQFVLESTSLLEWRLPGATPGDAWLPEHGKEPGFVPQPADSQVFLHEGQLAPGDNGDLLMMMRTARYDRPGEALDPPRAFSSGSRNGGRTWSPAIAEPDLYNSVAKGFFGRATGGTYLYVYNDGKAFERRALRYKLKRPDEPWSPERTFFDGSVHNSYPTLLEYAPGQFYAVWDSGTVSAHRTAIRFGKLDLR